MVIHLDSIPPPFPRSSARKFAGKKKILSKMNPYGKAIKKPMKTEHYFPLKILSGKTYKKRS